MTTTKQAKQTVARSVEELKPADAEKYQEASIKTVGNLKTIAHSVAEVSQLSLPEVDAVVEQVAQVVPAGNVPGVLLNGLARLPGRRPPEKAVKRDIGLLFKGVRQTLDQAVYGAAFAGPAAVIWGYQNLLRLSGKDPDEALPDGTWQFYLSYAMREDTARHMTETYGFDALLKQHKLNLSEADRITAWVMAFIHGLHQYDQLLENEWRERVYITLLRELTANEPKAKQFATLYESWEQQRPFRREQDAKPSDTYPIYRRRRFDNFFQAVTRKLSAPLQEKLKEQIAEAEEERLPDYKRQMSILAYLKADSDSEERELLDIKEAHIGIIHEGLYYLIPMCAPRSDKPADINAVRGQIHSLMKYPAHNHPPELQKLLAIKRGEWANIRKRLNADFVRDLDMLRTAPILINTEQRKADQPLAELRQTERGIGDHPLTVFNTPQSFLFDQSYIFFDGPWAASFAEIITNEALSWGVYLSRLPGQPQQSSRPYTPILKMQSSEQKQVQNAEQIPVETSAEASALNLKFLQRLRKLFKRRNDLLELKVSDMLILYRAIHALTYQPSKELEGQLKELMQDSETKEAAETALTIINKTNQVNPAIVIPVDASQRSPRDRLHPMTFEIPLQELDLLNLHQKVMAALNDYKQGQGDRSALYATFDQLQRHYLASLAGFGMVLSKASEFANSSEQSNMTLLSQMPVPLQKMFENIPNRFDALNDLIRGREMFTNIGVAPTRSSLKRFMSAKDDSEKKMLTWGVLTDANSKMRISLRDSRPHVGMLAAVEQKAVAMTITKEYLETYVAGLNKYAQDLWLITESSRETRMMKESETQMLQDLEHKKREGLL